MREIEANKEAWSLLSKEHYEHYKPLLERSAYRINAHIEEELGDISGKRIIHLQCNTGADTISLRRLGAARVTGVDLSPTNVEYASRMARELGEDEVDFIVCDIMELMERHSDTYDMVFTSEGVIGWLPDLAKWGRTIRRLLVPGGTFYVYDSHPFYMMMDEARFGLGELEVKYPYFGKEADKDTAIGGYAGESKAADNYFWMFTVGDVITSLAQAGLRIQYLHEFQEYICDQGGMTYDAKARQYVYAHNQGRYPMTFSIRASAD